MDIGVWRNTRIGDNGTGPRTCSVRTARRTRAFSKMIRGSERKSISRGLAIGKKRNLGKRNRNCRGDKEARNYLELTESQNPGSHPWWLSRSIAVVVGTRRSRVGGATLEGCGFLEAVVGVFLVAA